MRNKINTKTTFTVPLLSLQTQLQSWLFFVLPNLSSATVHLCCFFLLTLFSYCSIVYLQQNTVLHKLLQYWSWTAIFQEECGSPMEQSFCQKTCFSVGFSTDCNSCEEPASDWAQAAVSFEAHILALAWNPPQTAGWISDPPWSYTDCNRTSVLALNLSWSQLELALRCGNSSWCLLV